MSGCGDSEPFALQVTDKSMEPEFPQGCIIITEPGAEVEDGCYVVANVSEGVVLRQLIIRNTGWRLRALQPDIDELEIAGASVIRGRVIQKAGKRRSDRKTYV